MDASLARRLLRRRAGRAAFLDSELGKEDLLSRDCRFGSIYGSSYSSPAPPQRMPQQSTPVTASAKLNGKELEF